MRLVNVDLIVCHLSSEFRICIQTNCKDKGTFDLESNSTALKHFLIMISALVSSVQNLAQYVLIRTQT